MHSLFPYVRLLQKALFSYYLSGRNENSILGFYNCYPKKNKMFFVAALS